MVDLRQFDNTLLLCTVIGIGAGLAVALVLTGIFTRRFVQPIQSLAEASTAIARGKLDTQVPQAPYELGLLSDALSGMSEDLRQAQKDLKESNDNLNSILQGMDDGVIAVKEGSIVLLTGRAASMLGIPPAGAQRLEQCGANYLFVQDVLKKAQASELPVEEEITLHLPSERVIHVYAARLQPDDGTALLAVLSDITKLKELESLRSEFVANVTHELKTPLTSICGYVELLKGPGRDQEQIRQFCEIIEIETERLKHLIDDLLELSHLENNKEKSPLERVDLEQVVQRVAERTSALAKKAEIDLKWQVQPGLCLEADPNRIDEVIQNLTVNAIKYGRPGGYAAITAREERGAVVIRVSDDGIGIPADSIPRIFERFYRVDKSRSREQGGTGLGLSIVKHIVNLYHGDVSVESKEGDGSVFTVRLPKQQI